MTLLAMYEEADFNFLKKELGATDGNLSVQLRKLEEADYLTAHKEFVERKPRTTYAITKKGLEKLQKHLDTISAYQKIIEK
jgi:DNA-binding PadR family transcriptional regulator